jgi:hypothetical protein
MDNPVRRYFFPLLLIPMLLLGCPTEIPEPSERHFIVQLAVKNETASPITVSLNSLWVGGGYDGAGLDWHYEWIWEGETRYRDGETATIPPGVSTTLSVNSYCDTYCTSSGIGIASFILDMDGSQKYAGWDVSKYGNKVDLENTGTLTAVNFAGQGYGYVFVENKEAPGQWHSTFPPGAKTLKDYRITATYTVTLTNAGVAFNSVALTD